MFIRLATGLIAFTQCKVDLLPPTYPDTLHHGQQTRDHYYCGQSYTHFTIVNYDSTVVPDLKVPHIITLES